MATTAAPSGAILKHAKEHPDFSMCNHEKHTVYMVLGFQLMHGSSCLYCGCLHSVNGSIPTRYFQHKNKSVFKAI